MQYGLVAYVSDPVAQWVEQVRRELMPPQAGKTAHISILPPRPLMGIETEALETLEELCRDANPFEVGLGEVESFAPRTPTVFVRVAHAAYRMRELHDRLNSGPLEYEEPWPYMPHMTIVKMPDLKQAEDALLTAQERWTNYAGPRLVRIEQLVFVRGSQESGWADVARVLLGRNLSSVMAR